MFDSPVYLVIFGKLNQEVRCIFHLVEPFDLMQLRLDCVDLQVLKDADLDIDLGFFQDPGDVHGLRQGNVSSFVWVI